MDELFKLIERTHMGSWQIGHKSYDRKGYVTIDAPDHMSFAEAVVKMDADDKESPECLARVEALRLLFLHIDTLVERSNRLVQVENALFDLLQVVPMDDMTKALVKAQKLLS